jgi:hypothetical protein
LKEGQKWWESVEEDVRSYRITLRTWEDNVNWKRKHYIARCEELALEDIMDLPYDRLRKERKNEYKYINVVAGRWLDTPSLRHFTYWKNNMNMWIGFKSTNRILSRILWAFIKVFFLTSGAGTRYGLDGPGNESRWEATFSAPVQTCPRAHPASYTMGIGSFPGVKRPGRGVDYPPPSSARVEGRAELYICSPSGPSWPVLGWTLLLLLLSDELNLSIGLLHQRHDNDSATYLVSKPMRIES